MTHFFHHGVCWLLSAVLLFTNGWPLTVQHAHDVGEDLYHHSHHGDRFARETQPPAVGDADGAVAAATEHVHLLWLGWEVTIVPPQDGQPVPTPSDAAAAFAELDSKSTEVVATTADLSDRSLRGLCEALELPAVANRSCTCRPLASLPLCDRARHLRSGVQLI